MSPILVVFESRFGHCADVADHVAERIRERGLLATVLHAGVAHGADLMDYSGVVIVAPVYFGGYPQTVTKLLRERRVVLAGRPFAFVSVGNAAATGDRAARAIAERGLRRLGAETGAKPNMSILIGGAISYPHCGSLLRMAMKLHSFATGAPTDTSKAHDLTDWAALDRALLPFLALFERQSEPEWVADLEKSGVYRIPDRGVVSTFREG